MEQIGVATGLKSYLDPKDILLLQRALLVRRDAQTAVEETWMIRSYVIDVEQGRRFVLHPLATRARHALVVLAEHALLVQCDAVERAHADLDVRQHARLAQHQRQNKSQF